VLHRQVWGTGSPVVLIHGFTQSAHSWDPIWPALAPRHTVIALDAPGHGQSADIAADLLTGADLMVAAAPDPAAWLGYSMGGRFALHVAERHPESVQRLVVVSATGGIDDPGARAARKAEDETLAARAEADGLPAFVKWWLDRPLFATLPPDAAGVQSRLGGTSAGLASSLRLAGTGSQAPLWSRLDRLAMPVLVIAGELDDAYLALGRRLVDSIGANATMAVIARAGHACHLEQPTAFLDVVGPFLEEH
jgi:2-succinyl-6-hydroxy-2,4-cyclohexadiene-1-carboxylate synthase